MPSSDQSADHGHEQTNGNKIEQAVANDNGGVRAGVALNSSIGVDSQAITDSFWQTLQQGLSQPQAALSANKQLLQDLGEILFGNSTLTPESTDRRFDDEAWRDNPIFRRLGQSYLAWGSALDKWLDEVDMEHMDRQRARYLIDVAKDIFAPVNTLPGNPVALRKARKTFGRSLVQGARNFYDDLKYNHGYPSAAKRGSFKIGTDVAASEGAVVFRNELFELMQYQPKTDEVRGTPLLYVFSQVNRYYLGDLTPDRSLFQQLLDDGNTVFAISWRNPKAEHRDWNFDTYAGGVIEAIEIIRAIMQVPKIDLIGVCAGGLTTAVAAGVLQARGDDWLNTLSLFINVLDSRPEDSDFGLFVSPRSVKAQKQMVRLKGRYDEKNVFEMFARLRLEENIMSFFRSNYLLGESPPIHPLLFWSIDYSRVPSGYFGELLDMSVENKLAKNELQVLGQRIDLGDIKYPVYMLAGSTDHITPWKACYRSTQLFGGDIRFVLTHQAHTQTISSRPNNKHLKYWDAESLPESADEWAASATEHAGLWVGDWLNWLTDRDPQPTQPAPEVFGNSEFPEIDAAPGRYVLES